MNFSNQDDYIWAMRNAYNMIKDEKIETVTPEEVQNKLIATLIPDEILYNLNDSTHETYDGSLLLVVISGFTEMCEEYNKSDVGCPSSVIEVLNKYIGAMIQQIMLRSGEILKFYDDGFLAFWKIRENKELDIIVHDTMMDIVHKTLRSALTIQEFYGTYETDVDVSLKVKLAISVGSIEFGLIGDEYASCCVINGQPVWDVKNAALICKNGEIVLSPAAWSYINLNEYKAVNLFNSRFYKIPKKNYTTDDYLMKCSDDSKLRPSMEIALNTNTHEYLERFIPTPLKKSIKINEPFENLSEMRQLVVVYINVVHFRLKPIIALSLANKIYKLVGSIVGEANGCINEVSLTDFDMKLLVIFGLRGLKDELDCQNALKCALKCRLSVRKLRSIISVSIGITTGQTYCGLWGHKLRKEYKVTGLTVKKAERLMMMYRNKLVCDRETFVNSKMEVKNFILQEIKKFKGILQPGQFYEYHNEVTSPHTEIHPVSEFPLLGHDDKLILYRQLLDNFLRVSKKSDIQIRKMLIIQGVAKQGKTRLLQELIYITTDELPVYTFTLSENISKIPFETLRLIFGSPLGLRHDSNQKEKELKFTEILKDPVNFPELYCCINDIFGTNFKESTSSRSLFENKKNVIIQNFLKQLYLQIFHTKCIIVIDNFEYVDNESLNYFGLLLNLPNMFILASIGYGGKSISTKIESFLNDKRVEVRLLKAIDRWFYGGLACQFLKVYALPPELEKILQIKSNGNPGWIENFLTSMIHSESIIIENSQIKTIYDVRLICPPLYMIKRLSPKEKDEWQQLMEEKTPSLNLVETDDRWRKYYIDVCRDYYVDVQVRKKLQLKMKCPEVVPICLLTMGHNINAIGHELSMDTAILKTFDCLLSYEQLLIKCCASLGDQFTREMLLSVLATGTPREAALAIKKLFEIKVLACAKGNFIGGKVIKTPGKFMSPQNYEEVICECRGNEIDETCQDLPKYASCGYMQFYNHHFCEIIHNLLTDEQKQAFHLGAIKYLEKQTRKCRTCGCAVFHQILNKTTEKTNVVEFSTKHESVTAPSLENSTNKETQLPSTTKQDDVSDVPLKLKSSEICTINSDNPDHNMKEFKSFWGFRYISKLKDSDSLIRDFSTEDFLDCQCLPILTTSFPQLTAYYKSVGQWSKLLNIMLQYSNMSIRSSNLPLALTILKEAFKVLNKTPKADLPWDTILIRGNIFSLLGYVYIELDQLDDAEVQLQLALKQFHYVFPYNQEVSDKLKAKQLLLKQLFGLFVLPNTLTKKNLDNLKSFISNNLSEILSGLATLFMMRNQWEYAEIAVVRSLLKALKVNDNFEILCIAYSNMLAVALHYKYLKLTIALEVYALQLCNTITQRMERKQIKAVVKLYMSIFWSTLFRADLKKSEQIGHIAFRTAKSIKTSKLILPILPMLIYNFLLNKHANTAVQILKELHVFDKNNYDQSARLWYFAQCITFHLETGYVVKSQDVCEKFDKEMARDNFININDKQVRNHYCITMWLWCIRNRIWMKAGFLYLKIKEFYQLEDDGCIMNQLTGLYLLEGLIICLVYKIDAISIKSCIDIKREIQKLLKTLERSAETMKIIRPRLLHMKAYYNIVLHNDTKAFEYLEEANKLAVKYHNNLEEEWTTHSLTTWKQTMEASISEFWHKHSNKQNQLDYNEIEANGGAFGYYTLPLPMREQ